jgi:hypothetical protein
MDLAVIVGLSGSVPYGLLPHFEQRRANRVGRVGKRRQTREYAAEVDARGRRTAAAVRVAARG